MSNATETLIEKLNVVLSWELAGTIQYLQHSVMVTGPHRLELGEFFKDGSEEAHDHAEAVARKIAHLGGIPTVEPAQIRQAATLNDMLEAVLALEVEALAAWEAAWEVAGEVNKGTQFWIEEHIAEEQQHVDEVKMLLNQVSFETSAIIDASQKQSS